MHRFDRYKGFRDASLNLSRPLTILIGPNGAGKSNAIEGVELLSALAQGTRLHRITDTGRGGTCEVRGGLQGCPSYDGDSFTLGFSAWQRFERRKVHFDYDITVKTVPEPRIAKETLSFDIGKLFFETVEGTTAKTSGDVLVRYNNFARGGRKPQVSVQASRSALAQYSDFIVNNKKRRDSVRFVEGIRRYLQSSFVFDPRPNAMRRYERIGNDVLAKDGSNLSAVLYGLHTGGEAAKATLGRLFKRVKTIPDEPYASFDFVTTELGDVMFGMREEGSDALADARILSDGTLRSLAVLTALETAKSFSRVVVEEFDNGLHPSRVKVLINAISEAAENRKINVLVTTHNPATLNALSTTQLDGVVIVTRRDEDYSSTMIPLSEVPLHDELLERGRLGDVVTRRILDEYLNPRHEELRRQRMKEWLRGLP